MVSSQLKNRACGSLELHIPSTRDAVNTACETAQEFLRPIGVSRSPHVGVVLRELLLNAVVHGNQSVSSRTVVLRVETSAGEIKIEVEDEGPGFPHDAAHGFPPNGEQVNGRRGYILICALSDRVEFNGSGSRVTAYVPLRPRDAHH